MTLQEAVNVSERMYNYIREQESYISNVTDVEVRKAELKKFYEVVNVYTSFRLTIQEQTSSIGLLKEQLSGLEMQRHIAVNYDRDHYKELVKKMDEVSSAISSLMITTKANIPDDLMIKVCSYSE